MLAVIAALALVAYAPLILFPGGSGVGPLPGAPHASGEVARVTAAPLQVRHERLRPTPRESAAERTASSSRAVAALAGGLASETPGKTGTRALFRSGGGTPTAHPGESGTDEPCKSKQKGNGKAKGHDKPKHHGKAKGHSKAKHCGL